MKKKLKGLEGLKLLITAGPTWVPIDKVRVITNIFSGRLGITIAEEALRRGAVVTLAIGPGRVELPPQTKRLRVIQFRYFDELLALVKQLLNKQGYDIVIMSAAIADYTPVSVHSTKIKSGKKELIIRFKPTIKIIDLIKKIDPNIYLVKFKLEVDVSENELIDIAYKSMWKSKADLIVANEFGGVRGQHRAYIIDRKKDTIECKGKENIAKKLLNKIASDLKHGKT